VKDPSKLVGAGRLTLDFWDKEKGYYFNGTYYGDKDILALGCCGPDPGQQDHVHDRRADGEEAGGPRRRDGRIRVHEGQWPELHHPEQRLVCAGELPVPAGDRHRQVPAAGQVQRQDQRYHRADAVAIKLKTYEANVNYIIKEFSARVGVYYLNQADDPAGRALAQEIGLKLQLQM
jgi:hypothetical protein